MATSTDESSTTPQQQQQQQQQQQTTYPSIKYTVEEPCTKKAKTTESTTVSTTTKTEPNMSNQQVDITTVSNDNEWPEAWLIEENVNDQKKENKMEPNIPVTAAEMRELGIRYEVACMYYCMSVFVMW